MNSKIVTLVMGVFIATLFMSMSSDSEARHENPVYPVMDNCDQIITRTGDVISAKILEIGTTEIKYKKCDNLDGPTISIAKSSSEETRFFSLLI